MLKQFMNRREFKILFLCIAMSIVLMACRSEDEKNTSRADTTPPTISSTSPSNNATGLPVNTAITATFSEAMDVSTITTATFTLDNGATGAVTYNGTTATFTPSANLAYSTTYTATISTGVKDAAGNAMAGIYTWAFSTVPAPDTIPPTISSTSPSNNATGLPINTAITAIFSEAMDTSTITTATFTLDHGVTGTVTYNGTTATFTPSANLAYSTTYTATISTGVKDAAGNAMTANYVWHFTTEPGWQVTKNGNILEIAHKKSATDIPQYAALDLNSGYFRLNYGPQSGWGTSVVIMPSFWTGGALYQGAPIITSWVNDGVNLKITFTGTISGLNVQGQLSIMPPMQDTISATVTVNVTGDVVLDNRPGEAFKPVFLSSMRISSDSWDTQSAYVGLLYAGIPASGWIFSPPITGNTFGLTGGSSAWKTNAPTIEVAFDRNVQVTGWVTGSADPNDDNVGFWVATDSPLTSWQYTVTAKPF